MKKLFYFSTLAFTLMSQPSFAVSTQTPVEEFEMKPLVNIIDEVPNDEVKTEKVYKANNVFPRLVGNGKNQLCYLKFYASDLEMESENLSSATILVQVELNKETHEEVCAKIQSLKDKDAALSRGGQNSNYFEITVLHSSKISEPIVTKIAFKKAL